MFMFKTINRIFIASILIFTASVYACPDAMYSCQDKNLNEIANSSVGPVSMKGSGPECIPVYGCNGGPKSVASLCNAAYPDRCQGNSCYGDEPISPFWETVVGQPCGAPGQIKIK